MHRRSKWNWAILALSGFIVAGGLIGCGPRYGYHHHRDGYEYRDARRAYDYGYQRGFDHGRDDRRHHRDFNYEHDHKFRSGISRDRYINDRFREGYVAGYRHGYYGR